VDRVTTTLSRHPVVTVVLPMLVALVAIAGILTLASTDAEVAGAVILVPILVAISVPILSRRARLEGDRKLFWFLIVALLLKLGGGFLRYQFAFDVYEGGTDAAAYSEVGARIAEGFKAGILTTGLTDLSSTNFIRFFTGVVFTVIGPNTLGGFLVYSWLGFWGLYCFYRAFTIAVPEGRASDYGRLLFFLPSLLFWPSSIGKEAWMMFSLGIAVLGVARVLTGRTWRGFAVAALGLWLAALVRPHMAGLVGIALVGGILLRRPREASSAGLLAKGVALAAVTSLAFVLVGQAGDFLKEKEIETGQGITGVLQETSEITSDGGSTFAPSILQSPVRAPVAVFTVLFRPLIIEAHNLPAVAAALEMTFLFGFSVARWRWILAALRSVRRQPFVAFAVVYVAFTVLAFSGLANFGLLARERVQLLPLFLVLLTVPPATVRTEQEQEELRASR
jgi:hypothetical protein